MGPNDVIRYFDLQAERRSVLAVAHGGKPPKLPVFPQYVALVAGVVVEPFLRYYIEHGAWLVDLHTAIGRIIFAAIVGAMVFPGVYKHAFDPGKPLFVQLCAVFSAGIGWQTLIQGGSKLSGIG